LDVADVGLGHRHHDLLQFELLTMTRRRNVAVVGDRQGTAAIEFAIVAPVLFTVLLGLIDFGRMFYVRESLEYATEQAARYYALNPTSSTSNITTYLQGQMAGGMGSSISVNFTDTTSCNGKANVTCTLISGTYTFKFIAGYLGLGNKILQAKAQAVRVTS
jgi:Flp pilus assembly protein TadG